MGAKRCKRLQIQRGSKNVKYDRPYWRTLTINLFNDERHEYPGCRPGSGTVCGNPQRHASFPAAGCRRGSRSRHELYDRIHWVCSCLVPDVPIGLGIREGNGRQRGGRQRIPFRRRQDGDEICSACRCGILCDLDVWRSQPVRRRLFCLSNGPEPVQTGRSSKALHPGCPGPRVRHLHDDVCRITGDPELDPDRISWNQSLCRLGSQHHRRGLHGFFRLLVAEAHDQESTGQRGAF